MSDDDWSPGGGEVNANDSEEYEPDDLVKGFTKLTEFYNLWISRSTSNRVYRVEQFASLSTVGLFR